MRKAEFIPGSKLHGKSDAFGMIKLDGLHDSGGSGCVEINTLSLRDGQRSSVRSAYHDDGNADAVQPRYVANTGDAHRSELPPHALSCLGGMNDTVSPTPKGLEDPGRTC